MTNRLRNIRYCFELIIVKLGLLIFRMLGLKRASRLGSLLARIIGKRISVNELAKNNISKAFPHFNCSQVEKVLEEMWDNLGRVVGEFYYSCKLTSKQVATEYFTKTEDIQVKINDIRNKYNGGIIFTAHIGNWEWGSKYLSYLGLNVKVLYRPLNNKMVDKITSQSRNVELIAKGNNGNKQIIREIKKGNYIVIFMDQRVKGGIEVPFFHDTALTSNSIAKLAIKYNIPLIPFRSIRLNKDFKFKAEIGEVINPKKFADDKEDVFNITRNINQQIEMWIKKNPGQWFWVHNRWKK